eukprot:11175659-Lingulodinium_polyedra.AAC.1
MCPQPGACPGRLKQDLQKVYTQFAQAARGPRDGGQRYQAGGEARRGSSEQRVAPAETAGLAGFHCAKHAEVAKEEPAEE